MSPESEDVTIDARMAAKQRELRREAQALSKLCTAIGPLTKPRAYQDLSKIPALLEKVGAKVEAVPLVAERGRELLEGVREDLRERQQRQREALSRELRQACDREGLTMHVLRREEPVELRIPPFGVRIDRAKGQAEVTFAKQAVVQCAAEANAIVAAHAKALKELGGKFDPAKFFRACHTAWNAARGAGLAGAGDRVEILDFLPYMALQFQPTSWRVDPNPKNFRAYSRARFAFDLLQLRNAGALTQGDLRLNLGVATGTTASKKNRVLWIEDEEGRGEFKLTVFFTSVESRT